MCRKPSAMPRDAAKSVALITALPRTIFANDYAVDSQVRQEYFPRR